MTELSDSYQNRPLRIAALISGGGTTVLNIIDRIEDGSLDAELVCAISSNLKAAGIQRISDRGHTVHAIPRKSFENTTSFSDEVWTKIREAEADLVVLAGFLSLLIIPDDYQNRVMNIHPALLPNYGGKGMFGHHVHTAVVNAGETESGCTVHFATNEYDAGPIILQRTCPVLPGDSPDDLAARVMEQEKRAYPEAIRLFKEGKIHVEDNQVIQIDVTYLQVQIS